MTPDHADVGTSYDPLVLRARRIKAEHAEPGALAHPESAIGTELQRGGVGQFTGPLAVSAEAEGEAPVGLEYTDFAALHVGDDDPSPFVRDHMADIGE